MESLRALSTSLPVPQQTLYILIGVVVVNMVWLRSALLFGIALTATAYFVWRGYTAESEKKQLGEAKKKDAKVTPPPPVDDNKKPPASPSFRENEGEMKNLMKEMKRDQRKRRESDKEALQRGVEEEESRKKAEESKKRDEKASDTRSRVAKELFETEKSYVDKLKALVEIFENPMKQSQSITTDQISRIFSNVGTLCHFNEFFLADLEKIITNWSESSGVGEVFLKGGMAEFMKLYIIFVNNYTVSMETLSQCRQNAQFCTLLEACERNPRCAGHDLASLLIMPVQRIPRYILLLSEIQKHTPASHPEYAKLTQALAKLKDVAKEINEAKREAESHLRLYELSKSMDNLNEPLIRPSRKLIMEGKLKQKPKAASLSEEWEISTYFLFTDILVQAKEKGKKFTAKSKTPLNALQIARYENKQEFGMLVNNTFMVLTTADGGESYEKWVQAIMEAKANLETVKSIDLGSPGLKAKK